MSNKNENNTEGIIFAIVVVIVVMLITFSCGSDSGSSSSKYDYVTNSDGSRTWYDTTNDHIVRFD